MQIGDLVQSLQGNWRRVVAITPVANQETVYNFTVDQNHDYFVGETGFLVHNAGDCGCDIRFTQNTIKTVFKDGRLLQDTINEMRAAGGYPDSIPPIRIFQQGGNTWTLDNRRLFAANQAGVPPNTVPATPEEIEDEIGRKMTTPCEGRFIGVKGPIE